MKRSRPHRFLTITWTILWLVLPLSDRWTVGAIWLFGLAVAVHAAFSGSISVQRPQRVSLSLFIAFLAWHMVSLYFDADTTLWWKTLEKKSPLLVIPLLLSVVDQRKFSLEKYAIYGFFTGLTIAGIVMTGSAAWHTFSGSGTEFWTYHALATPFTKGAIFFSWFYASAIIYLIFRKQQMIQYKPAVVLLIFFMIMLLLLSSKLFILLTLPVAFIKLFVLHPVVRRRALYKAVIVVLVIIALTPFFGRMSELGNSRLDVLQMESFTYDTPLNGLTFRLLQYRFAAEILEKHQGFLTGVGINSEQAILDQHYRDSGIYTGNPDLGDTGYLGYNFHNQLLETLVGTGFPGLVILLLIIMDIFFRRRNKLLFPLYVYFITVVFFLTESVLERQAGLVFFSLIVFTFSEQYLTRDGDSAHESR